MVMDKNNPVFYENSIDPVPAVLDDRDKVRIVLAQADTKEAEFTLKTIRKFNIVNEIFWVRNGEETLDIALGREFFGDSAFSDQPKLLLLDLRLPELNGFEILKEVRSTQKTKNIPVILFVSSDSEADKLDSLGPNYCSYIVKPIDSSKLKEAIWATDYFILSTFGDVDEKHTLYQMGWYEHGL